MRKSCRCLIAALILTAGFSQAAPVASKAGEEENPTLWKSRVTSVAVFKNGLGFFVREGQTQLQNGWCVAGELPSAHFGTLAFFPQAKDEIVDVVGAGPGEVVEFDGADAPADTATKRARLEAVRYLKLKITYLSKETERTTSGKLMSIGSDFVVVESDGANIAVPLEGIKKMQVLEQPLRVHVAGAKDSTKLCMAYLRKGITWVPEYTLKVIDEETAELSLRGTLINEAEDLVHADVNFVVGVPHFMHTDYLAPIVAGQTIRAIGTAVAPKEVMTQLSNGFTSLTGGNLSYGGLAGDGEEKRGEARDTFGNLPQMESQGNTDFTVYTKKDLTLRRGEKAIVSLFVKKIKYSHIYRWSPPAALEHFLMRSRTRRIRHGPPAPAWRCARAILCARIC